jgi:hypothetical protein
MDRMIFDEYVRRCKKIARDLNTICEVREYDEFNWARISFMTDHFGGTYVNLHYDMKTGRVVNWYGHEGACEVKNINELASLVEKELARMKKKRDLNLVAEMVNAEY